MSTHTMPSGVVIPIGHTIPARLIDDVLEVFDVANTYSTTADGEVRAGGLDANRLVAPVAHALAAIGAGDRLALKPALVAASPDELVFALAWRVEPGALPGAPGSADDLSGLAGPGLVKVAWNLRARRDGEGKTLLSTTVRLAGTDEVTRARLLAGLALLVPFSQALARRLLATAAASARPGTRDEGLVDHDTAIAA